MAYKYPSQKMYQGDFDTLQRDILQAIYDLYIEDSEPVVYRTIIEKLDNEITNNAIACRMRRLEQDGYVYRDNRGNWYLTKRGIPQQTFRYPRNSHPYRRHKLVEMMAIQAKQSAL